MDARGLDGIDDAGSGRGTRFLPFPVRRAVTAPLPPELAQAEALWEGLRVAGALPPRSAIEPRALAPVLDRTLLAERIAPGVVRLRLAGARLADLMGMDLRGMPLTALIEPAARGAVAAAVEAVFARPAILDLALEAERGLGRPALTARLLLMPLTGPRGAVDRALGVAVLTGAPGRAPRRFAPAHAVHRPIAQPIAGPAPGLAEDHADDHAAAALPGMADAGEAWQPLVLPLARPAAPPRAPHLRLVGRDWAGTKDWAGTEDGAGSEPPRD